MLVFMKPPLVFLATPKTASTAIQQALGSLSAIAISQPAAMKHTSVGLFDSLLKPYLKATTGLDFATTALMREPRDWLGSWYRNRQSENEAKETSTQDIGFEDFVRLACSEAPPAFAQVGSQAAFLMPHPALRVEHIFRYDRLDQFVQFLEERLNFEIVLPRLNVSPKGDLHLSGALEELVRKTFAADFALYRSLGAKA
jgi:hypothetical protein